MCAAHPIPENLSDMDTCFDGLIQPSYMEKFREGPYEEASTAVKEAWKMVMMKFLPKISKGWAKKMRTALLSNDKETTEEMEALVCWYVDMHGDSRWEPEHRENEEKRAAGEEIDRRGKRAGDQENEKRKQGPLVFVKYLKLVKARRAASKDWERALQEAAEQEDSEAPAAEAGAGVEETEHTGRRKKQKKADEPIIPMMYRFADDGTVMPITEV